MSFKQIVVILALFASAMPCARAQAPQTKDLVAELAAQKQKNSEESESLKTRLDSAYNELQQTRIQREKAMQAVLITAIVSGGTVALVLILLYRSKLKSASELKALNERLDKQWKDLCKANDELVKVNKELAASVAELTKKK
ncbi:MAG: hypothetical protein WC360_00485 [Opitutales bacterium]